MAGGDGGQPKVVMEGWWSVVTADRSSGGSEEGSCAAAG